MLSSEELQLYEIVEKEQSKNRTQIRIFTIPLTLHLYINVIALLCLIVGGWGGGGSGGVSNCIF